MFSMMRKMFLLVASTALASIVVPADGSTTSTHQAERSLTARLMRAGKPAFVPSGGSIGATVASTATIATATATARILSRDEKESKMLQVSLPLSQTTAYNESREGPLMADIELLSGLLSDIVLSDDPRVHDLYEKFRLLGKERAARPEEAEPLEAMVAAAARLTAQEALGVCRTFSIMLNLVNAAEVQHRHRMIQQHESRKDPAGGPLPLTEDSIRGTMEVLLKSNHATVDEIYQQLLRQKVEIVLTAHPTQVQRKALLRKYRKISEGLEYLERPDLDPFERLQAVTALRRILSSAWGADEIRRVKPTPQQEAAGGNAVIESVLWDAVPAYLRKLDAQCRLTLNRRLPVDAAPIRFASWIGGDRDGNPNVTPEVTKEVVLQQRLRAARLLLRDMYQLFNEMAISYRFSAEMESLAANVTDSPHVQEKYRRVIASLICRLARTAHECEAGLADLTSSSPENDFQRKTFLERPSPALMMGSVVDGDYDEESGGGGGGDGHSVEPIYDTEELLGPLKIMYRSLQETGFDLVAGGLLADIIRRLAVFGMSLVPLDIREESTKHTQALSAITRWLGIGCYEEWTEETRLAWLTAELSNKRPLYRVRDIEFSPEVMKTLRTFKVASQLRPADLGSYVISQCQTASDVLAVMLLQKQNGMTANNGNMMRVVPLFETLDDLNNAPDVLDTLFRIPVYVGAVRGSQEVMVGYSDSAKDAGRLAASWAQYESQENMVQVANRHGVELTFFHGKGGTVGRGGNPSVYRAIMSHPPSTINGRFRVTEQGEMITQNFGAPSIAERTLDIYTAAVCRESFARHVEPKESWRDQMVAVSDLSCREYRDLVRGEPRFVPYFRQATPEVELGSLNIGSRPAKRNPAGGIESLRAIPWTFAWTQTRTHLSAWLGVGAGLRAPDAEKESSPPEDNGLAIDPSTLREMYKEWPWFRETIDLIAMILSKTDFSISENYDEQLVEKDDGLVALGKEIREKMVQTRQAVLDVSESNDDAGVQGAHVALMRASSTIRHPYVDPINVIQAELLKRLRAFERKEGTTVGLTDEERNEKEILKDAIVVSINGIAQGMRNSA